MEVIDIALAADGGYFCGLFVTACSIAKHAANDVTLRFNILDGGIEERDWNLLVEKVGGLHSAVEFNRLTVDDEMFADYPDWHGNKMAYARLMLPDALPDPDWCIYCDVDFLWMRDIAELWAERDERYAFIGTMDGAEWTLTREKAWFEKNGYPFDPKTYFCSGLCFFNLKAFREQGLIRKVEGILRKHYDIQYPDQAALNIATFGQTKIVSQIWQRFPERVTQAELNAGCVVHHAGELPWKRVQGYVAILSDTIMLWHRFNAEIHGISVWQSLRRYNPAVGILYHRALFWLMRCPLVAWPLKFVCNLLRHPGVYGFLECRAKRLRI